MWSVWKMMITHSTCFAVRNVYWLGSERVIVLTPWDLLLGTHCSVHRHIKLIFLHTICVAVTKSMNEPSRLPVWHWGTLGVAERWHLTFYLKNWAAVFLPQSVSAVCPPLHHTLRVWVLSHGVRGLDSILLSSANQDFNCKELGCLGQPPAWRNGGSKSHEVAGICTQQDPELSWPGLLPLFPLFIPQMTLMFTR